jgi:hypothetical protein
VLKKFKEKEKAARDSRCPDRDSIRTIPTWFWPFAAMLTCSDSLWSRDKNKTNSVALSPRANYTDWSTATCRRNVVPTFVDRGVSCGQRGGSWSRDNIRKYMSQTISCSTDLIYMGSRSHVKWSPDGGNYGDYTFWDVTPCALSECYITPQR